MSPRRPRTWGQKIGLGFAFVMPFLVTLFVVRAIFGSMAPDVVIPPLHVPTPNAFDVFVQAGKMTEKDGDAISDAYLPRPGKALSRAEKEVVLARNAPALALLRRGLTIPYRDASGPRSFDTKFPQYAQFRTLTRLMVLEGDVKRENGDTEGAAQSYADAVVFGHTLLQGAPLIGHLVGRACEAIGRKPLWKMVDTMDAQTARQTARRLESAFDAHPGSMADTLAEEKLWGQSYIMEFFTKKTPGFSLAGAFWSKRTTMNNYTTYMDQSIAGARQPYQVQPKLPPEPTDILNQNFLPSLAPARYKSESNNTQNALLVAALAVQAFRAEHKGAYPETLSALVPAYLSHVPDDPLSYPVAPLRYKRTGTGYVLYSVGPDGKDDAAVPALNDSESGITAKSKYYSTATSKGDIVSGVNLI